MTKAVSAGIIIAHGHGPDRRYLVLKAKLGKAYSDFPKGAVEDGESLEQAARREVKEETGIVIDQIFEGFQEKITYRYIWDGDPINKEVYFFLAQVPSMDVTISHEHVGFRWYSYQDMLRVLTFPNQKRVIKAAEAFLNTEEA